MSRPVDKIDFWKGRITDSKNSDIHHSVYRCNGQLWSMLEDHHVRIMREHIKPTDKVLDAACGYGRMSQYFKKENYVGVDFSPDFIEIAKQDYPNNSFIVGDLKNLPFEDEEFDWSFGVSIKDMIVREIGEADWSLMEKELRRVSKKIILLEYSDGKGSHLTDNYKVIK